MKRKEIITTKSVTMYGRENRMPQKKTNQQTRYRTYEQLSGKGSINWTDTYSNLLSIASQTSPCDWSYGTFKFN